MTDWNLEKHPTFAGVEGPVLAVVMDGVGHGNKDESDAVWLARTPNLDFLAREAATTALAAHGVAVGMPSDADMGNSEVGHNALGRAGCSTRAPSWWRAPSSQAACSRARSGRS